MNTTKHFFALLTTVVATGCSQQKPPECFSPDTVGLVKDVVAQMAEGKDAPLASRAEMVSLVQIGTPTPTAYNKDVKRFTCEGMLTIPNQLPTAEHITSDTDPDTLQKIIAAGDVLCPDGKCQTMVNFTSQTVDDRHVVSVEGLPRWLISALALQAQVQVANRNAKALAEDIAKKEHLVLACDHPDTIKHLKLAYTERLFEAAEQQLAANKSRFIPVKSSEMLQAFARLDAELSVDAPTKISFTPDPVRITCTAKVSVTASYSQAYSVPVVYEMEPVEGSNGSQSNLYVTPDFPGADTGYRSVIAMREFLAERMPAGQPAKLVPGATIEVPETGAWVTGQVVFNWGGSSSEDPNRQRHVSPGGTFTLRSQACGTQSMDSVRAVSEKDLSLSLSGTIWDKLACDPQTRKYYVTLKD